MEKIYVIEEGHFKKDASDYKGFLIATNKQIVKLGVTSSRQCRENFGYFASEDDLSQFIGAGLISIEITDTALNTHKFTGNLDRGAMMFVNFNTTKGILQFVVYNSHNGYYGHDACVVSEQLNYKCRL